MRSLFLAPLLVLSSVCFGQDGSCNNQTSVTYQGYEYDVVEIGDQCWFAENLRATAYSDGTSITQIMLGESWEDQITGVYGFCEDVYGAYYNWHAATHSSGLCPDGWHVPSKSEWEEIFETIDQSIAGAHLKHDLLWNGVNTYGFSALPAGTHMTSWCDDGDQTRFWTSTNAGGEDSWNVLLDDNNVMMIFSNQKYHGWSVRCMSTNYVVSTHGCTVEQACNFNSEATIDDGSCDYCFCGEGTQWSDSLQACIVTDAALMTACGEGTYWEELVEACMPSSCLADLDGDGMRGTEDLLMLLSVFDSECPPQEPETSEWNCGDPLNYHGYDYVTVQIGGQCWFAQNLRNTNYANGDVIPGELTDSEWGLTTEGSHAAYDNDDASLSDFGRLYNWYAVVDSRGLCPSGWHVPTDGEFMTLEMELGMSESEADSEGWRGTDQGIQMKSSPTDTPSWNGSNSSGFSGLAGGYRSVDCQFYFEGVDGWFWSSTPNSNGNAWTRHLWIGSDEVIRYAQNHNRSGFSARCIKD